MTISVPHLRHEIMACTSLETAARQLSLLARFTGVLVVAEFNGVTLYVTPRDTARTVILDWEALWYAKHPEMKA